ncbi:uncharacterized protein LOC143430024 [Xylocopa sonorina]|uniref:uncharacterized protein LOC143430024 n=1 Tax=Xylocopa sonorina TaxID=1818115 RepID=UPI00403AE88E
MDERILKILISSCESATKDLENSRDYKMLLEENKFLPTSNDIFNALCTSLTKLLTYKVSKEAYQRYTVRFNVINVIREFCRINDAFEDFKVLRDQEHASTFLNNLLEKYLTDDVLDYCDTSNNLSSLTSALMCLTSTNSYYKVYLEKVLVKLAELESSDESEYLLCNAVQNNSNLNLDLATIEKIYHSQKCKLIEEPLLSDFVSSCTSLNKDDGADNSESLNLINQLFEFTSKSSYIFLLVCAFLKELMMELDHAPTVMNFIQSTLKRIKEFCKNQGKDILDLYPRNLQSLVILLGIEPTYHTDDTRSSTLNLLRTIYDEDENVTIMLLSHYPQWLMLFEKLLNLNDIR